VFDPKQVSYRDLVCEFNTPALALGRLDLDCTNQATSTALTSHDPTTVNRQGVDTGSRAFNLAIMTAKLAKQLVQSIFTHTPEQLEIAKQVTAEVQAKHFDPKGKKIVTEITDAGEYHQKLEYLDKNPFGYQCPTHRLHW
jgi:peptide-methionine (S)-S-oxide reductase